MQTAAYSSRIRIGTGELRRRWELVAHLAAREVAASHRWTLLGWTWPLARQLAQLGVLVFVFSGVLDLGIPNYPVFVFRGRFPTEVLPLIAVGVPFIDVLLAAPVLLAMVVAEGALSPALAFAPV